MEYINSISIGNSKGVKELNINSFSSVNIITGPNGSGKTTLLKALEILTNPGDFSHYAKVSGNTYETFSNSFDKRQPRPYTSISGTVLNLPYSLEITSYLPITKDGFFGYHHFGYQSDGIKKRKTTQISYSFSEEKDNSSRILLPFRMVSPKETSVCLNKIREDETVKEKVLSILSLFDDEICDFHTEDFKEYFIYQLAKDRQIQVFLVTQSAEVIDEWLDLLHFYHKLEFLTILRLRSDKKTTSCQLTKGERAYQMRLENEADFRDEK